MIGKKTEVSVIILLVSSLAGLYAQELVTTAGGEGSGTGGSVSYTIGQLVYRTHSAASGSVAEGVQQPYEISVVTGIDENVGFDLRLTAYPNPVSDFLVLKIDASALMNYRAVSYRLYDLQGNMIINKNVLSDVNALPMNALAPGIYLLKVYDSYGTINQKNLKTFKVIKIN